MRCAIDLARVHIRFYEANAFIRGRTMINWVTDFNMFGMYKRMWVPVYPNARTPYYLGDNERLQVQKNCAFLTFTSVGIGLTGITGDMDNAISLLGLENVIGVDLPKLVAYARGSVHAKVVRE